MINIFQPALGNEELAAVQEVFKSNWIGKGNSVLEFERLFAEQLKQEAKNFTTTTCCTEGIFLSTEIFNFQRGDEVIVPSISFVAVASAVIKSGAKLVFCDVDQESLNVRASDIEACITPATKAVYITHYAGVPCDMDPILELCQKRNITVIEDSACAVRSFYKGRACGTMSDMGIWSFDAMKTICTGDGGMLYFKDLQHVAQAKETLYLGLPNRQKSGMDSSASGNANWWEYQVESPGRRAIMNNISGAIGCVQIKKLDMFLERRAHIHNYYMNELGNISEISLPAALQDGSTSSYYFFSIQLEERDRLAKYLLDNGVYSTFRYWPLHKVRYFAQYALGEELPENITASELEKYFELPNSDFASKHTLNIPLHHSLSDQDIETVVALLKGF